MGEKLNRDDSKCGSAKCDTVKNARMDIGKCRIRLAVWKAEPILYSDTALSYFSKIVLRLLSE